MSSRAPPFYYKRKEYGDACQDEESHLLGSGDAIAYFSKWRMLAIWFLLQNLGADHPYTLQFMANVRDQSFLSIGAGVGILQALKEDYKRSNIKPILEQPFEEQDKTEPPIETA